jgi:ABC-type dipeptide/oligopeptide/nickel transport system permease subunit
MIGFSSGIINSPANGSILKEIIMKETLEALPQMVFIVVLLINLITSLIDSNRNFKASLIATIVLVAITHWGGFFKPLLTFLINV